MKIKKITLILSLLLVTCLIYAQELRIEPNTSLTIEAGTTIDLSGGNLILESDVSGDASLIDKGNITYSGGGNANVQRYLTEGKWHLVSSPVSNAQSGLFLADYLQYHTESTNGWTDIVADNYSLNIMQGYDLWSVEAGPTTEVFVGATNTGTLNKSFTQSGLGWNLVGNPYPSSIDWDAVSIPAQLSAAIWIYDPGIGANGDYLYYINGGGIANTTSQYIPSGQGFFVRATSGSGTLTFENNDRVHSSQAFLKDTEENNSLVLRAFGNNTSSQTAIRFLKEATQELDRLYDVYKIITDSPEVPVLYTLAENEKMAINTLPAIEGNEVVPVWFIAGVDGTYSIDAIGVETFDADVPIFIEDLESGVFYDLKKNNEFTFDYKSGSEKSFLIHFSDPQTPATSDDINIYAYNNILNVNFPSSNLSNPNFSAQIYIFDITGKLIQQVNTSEVINQLPIRISNSIYMVQVISESGSTSAKVFNK
jgi:hypothetical protein